MPSKTEHFIEIRSQGNHRVGCVGAGSLDKAKARLLDSWCCDTASEAYRREPGTGQPLGAFPTWPTPLSHDRLKFQLTTCEPDEAVCDEMRRLARRSASIETTADRQVGIAVRMAKNAVAAVTDPWLETDFVVKILDAEKHLFACVHLEELKQAESKRMNAWSDSEACGAYSVEPGATVTKNGIMQGLRRSLVSESLPYEALTFCLTLLRDTGDEAVELQRVGLWRRSSNDDDPSFRQRETAIRIVQEAASLITGRDLLHKPSGADEGDANKAKKKKSSKNSGGRPILDASDKEVVRRRLSSVKEVRKAIAAGMSKLEALEEANLTEKEYAKFRRWLIRHSHLKSSRQN